MAVDQTVTQKRWTTLENKERYQPGTYLSGARIWFEQNQKDGEDSIGHIISHNFANQEKIQKKKSTMEFHILVTFKKQILYL